MKYLALFGLLWLFSLTKAFYLQPDLPLEDDFYNAPDNLEDYTEGDIIRYRSAPLMIRSVYYPVNVKNAWQFLVRSQNSMGNATAVVTTVLEPYDADPSKVLSYQVAEDSASPDCAPSYSMLFGAKMVTVIAQLEMILISTGLSRGWYVVSPDYEGTHGAFTVGRQAGKATLDSIRAVLASHNTTGINPDAKVALWGYSGGTIASGWAAQLQPQYAPELKDNMIGVAMGGWVTNVTLTAVATEGGPFAGLVAAAVNGMINEYTDLRPIALEAIRSDRLQWFDNARNMCLLESVFTFAFHRFFTGSDRYVDEGFAIFTRPEIKKVLDFNTLAFVEDDGIPEIPMFVFHGEKDEIVPFLGAKRAYDNYCDWGIDSLEMAVSNSTGHLLEVVEGSGAAIKWLEDRFNGKENIVKGCQRTDRFTNLDYPGADLAYFQLVRTLFSSIPGGKIGESYDRNATVPDQFRGELDWIIEKLEAIGPLPIKK